MATQREPAVALARRLRELRMRHWPGVVVKQDQLKIALGVSVPLISSWENDRKPVTPPEDRLNGYALFFATQRSLDGGHPHLLDLAELTEVEETARLRLASELKQLRSAASGATPVQSPLNPILPNTAPVGQGFWRFPDNAPVTIVCGLLTEDLRGPYTDPDSPDYVALYSYADLDAMIELHGHIRAANPDAYVNYAVAKGPTKLNRDHLMNHLVVLGGVDFNPIGEEVLEALEVPVRQVDRDSDPVGAFKATDGKEPLVLAPKFREAGGSRFLIEDIAHFVRGRNPFNAKRTVTICNGQFGRGVYGAVRTLTDIKFRDRNAAYLRRKFEPDTTFSILSRVSVVRGEVITPDWTLPGTILHEWHVN